jgi:hypothetical protein
MNGSGGIGFFFDLNLIVVLLVLLVLAAGGFWLFRG